MFFTSIKSGSISILVAVLFALPCFGQLPTSARYELVLETGLENPRVAPLGKDGALIYRRIRDKTNDLLELIKIDSSLQENWRGAIAIDKNLTIAKVEAYEHFVFILLNSINYGGFDLTVVAVNVQTQNYNSYVIKNLIPLKPTELKVTTRAILIGGYFNDIPVVLHFNLLTGRSRLLPGFFNDAGELNQIKTYDDGLIDIIVSMKNILRKKVLWLRSYSPEGDLINTSVLQDGEKNLLFGKSLRKKDGTQIVIGNFGLRNFDYSKGIFYTEINPAGEYTIRYYNFSDLENYFKYMKPAKEARVKERIERRKQNGRKVRHSYQFLTQELVQNGDEYLFLGESYYPRYYYLSTFGYTMRGERIFDGYRYTHASILGFDNQGNLRWDNSFEINDVKTFNIKQYVKLVPKEDTLGLVYLYENKVRSKIIHRNQVVRGKSLSDLKLKYDFDMVKERNTESSSLEYWYDPYFLAYGIQNINSKNEKNYSERKVLFINKLIFQ